MGMQDVVTGFADVKPIWVIRDARYHPDGTMPLSDPQQDTA
jgi:hypothetical protein